MSDSTSEVSEVEIFDSDEREAIEAVCDELMQRTVGEPNLEPIFPKGKEASLDSAVRLEFEVPFQKMDKVIVQNGSAAFLTTELLKIDAGHRLWRFMEYNFPVVCDIYVRFTVGASWCGGIFSAEIQRDVESCARAILSMIKLRKFYLQVRYPFSHESKQQDEMLSDARRRILAVFHDEARKIDKNYPLPME